MTDQFNLEIKLNEAFDYKILGYVNTFRLFKSARNFEISVAVVFGIQKILHLSIFLIYTKLNYLIQCYFSQ